MRAKLEQAQAVTAAEAAQARESVRRWRDFRPSVDLYVAPVLGQELPPVDCDELEVRLPLTAFLRPFNVLGWAASRSATCSSSRRPTRPSWPQASPGSSAT